MKIGRAARKPEVRKGATQDSHKLNKAWFNFIDSSGNFSEKQESHGHYECNGD